MPIIVKVVVFIRLIGTTGLQQELVDQARMGKSIRYYFQKLFSYI